MIDVKGFKKDNQPTSGGFLKKAAIAIVTLIVLVLVYYVGSIPVDIILDLFNLDADEVHEKLKQDMFTVKDAAYNDMLRNIYSDLATNIVENTDLADQVIDYVIGPEGKKLNRVQNEEPTDESGEDGGWDDSGMENFDETPNEEQAEEPVEDMNDEDLVQEYIDEQMQSKDTEEVEASSNDEEIAELFVDQSLGGNE